MRTIKFRVWTGNRMLYDCGVVTKGNKILVQDKGKLNLSIPMQFTGLKDVFGKEIYEDDIVKYKKGIWKVNFDMGKFSLFSDLSNLSTSIIEDSIMPKTEEQEIADKLGVWWTSCEVIGNIYENPELLEDGK